MASAPSGWYPDPDDAERLRWWDGATWQEQRRPRPNPRRSAWVWAASTGGGFLIACFVVGFGRAMVLLGLFAVVAALVALSGKTFAWLRAGIWKAFTLGAGAILLLGGGAATAATDAGARTAARLTGAPIATAEARASSTPPPSPAPNVTVEELTVTEPVPFARTQQDDPGRDIGTSAVIVAGADGVRTIVYAVTYRDGVEAGRRVVSNTITTSPVDEVTAVGTRQPAPAPPPPPAPVAGGGCHPSYADVCVPFASDVDCAGGSGNGPAYVSGPLRVVGPDVYDLDRDGDGIACDR